MSSELLLCRKQGSGFPAFGRLVFPAALLAKTNVLP